MKEKRNIVTTQIDREQWRRFKIECLERGISIHDAVDEALRWWLSKPKGGK